MKRVRRRGFSFFPSLIFIFGLLSGFSAQALLLDFKDRYAPLILSETAPFVFSPAELGPEDYKIVWAGKPLSGVTFRIGKKSVEWVRGDLVFVLPRGRLILEAQGIEAGDLKNQGYMQSMVVEGGKGQVEMPIAMLAGEHNRIRVRIKRRERIETGHLELVYTPRPQFQGLIMTDSSCSPYNVRAIAGKIPKNSWLYLSCRLVYSQGDKHQTSSLELYAHFNNVGEHIQVNGLKTKATSDSLWALRLRSKPGYVRLGAKGEEVKISYSARERLRFGSLAMGIGPYGYQVEGATTNVDQITGIATFYASYFIQEDLQIVAFDAVAFHKNWFTDLGIYARLENTRAIDERFSFNLLLGFHTLAFRADGLVRVRVSAPQGIELVVRDFLKRRWNFSLGSFLYPPIDDRAYYNFWVRYGTGKPFYEINYIDWQEPVNGSRVRNRSLGFTVGFPIGGFL